MFSNENSKELFAQLALVSSIQPVKLRFDAAAGNLRHGHAFPGSSFCQPAEHVRCNSESPGCWIALLRIRHVRLYICYQAVGFQFTVNAVHNAMYTRLPDILLLYIR